MHVKGQFSDTTPPPHAVNRLSFFSFSSFVYHSASHQPPCVFRLHRHTGAGWLLLPSIEQKKKIKTYYLLPTAATTTATSGIQKANVGMFFFLYFLMPGSSLSLYKKKKKKNIFLSFSFSGIPFQLLLLLQILLSILYSILASHFPIIIIIIIIIKFFFPL